MNAGDFLTLAQQLVGKGSRASEFRSAISRAYYATYHTAFERLSKVGCTPPSNKTAHRDVQEYLENSGDSDLVKLAGLLRNLHSNRIKADYRLADTAVENPKTALAIVQGAEVLIRNINQRFASIDPAGIAKSIKTWRPSA